MNKQVLKPWYEKNWLVILLCIFIFPIGLYALWKNTSISKGWKIGVTALWVIGLTTLVADPDKSRSERNAEAANTASEQQDKAEPASANSFLVGTTWKSTPLTIFHSSDSDWNVVMLRFYADSVLFWLPYGSWSDASDLLSRTLVRDAKTHYTWDYSVKGNQITLDPGLTGWSIPLEVSGDSLIWKGHTMPRMDNLSFRKLK